MPKNLSVDPFAEESAELTHRADAPTHESIMVPLMGVSTPLDQIPRNVVARPVSIFEIERDPLQPRRAIPSAAMVDWDGSAAHVPSVLERWYVLANQQTEGAIALDDYLQGEAPKSNDRRTPLADSFIDLLGLARSILDHGLDNPILVAAGKIESGERRWLAYHLLYSFSHDDHWSRIPAREVGQPNVWRQAGENGARSNLNAISLARQLALLIMDLYRALDVEFQPYDIPPGTCDQPFYAQVADGDEYRVPPGAKNRLLAAMGLKNAVQLRQYRALLRVPAEIWTRADDENWPETWLREFIRKSKPATRNSSYAKPIKLKITSDLAPRWDKVRELILAHRPSATDQSILGELVEFYLSERKS